eukprot:CAMPEP_0168195144 /NCGR_PEP_ID=MMETSP0139_2-20121125/19669_1 /TAXON_ID=44445 /ORGANISM="Pseudo-nitzschia australis, Strain 10249 10 AB" /LENGTH=306 /DNA_ID=CAMNT_0008118919 /DNA_START=203 /DNA_END=1123 /DNA_ORIENTATION=+
MPSATVASSNNNTTNTNIIFEVNRTWAPLGVDRFYALAKDNYYNCAALFRVVPNFVVQLGIASDPFQTAKWDTPIPDDPVLEGVSNTVGMVSFATSGPDTRTTQIFVNTVDNARLDEMGFAPFARVVQGMDEVFLSDLLYVADPVPDQQTYEIEGNTWILEEYQEIDIIKGLPQQEVDTATTAVTEILLTLEEEDDETSSNDEQQQPIGETPIANDDKNSSPEIEIDEVLPQEKDGANENVKPSPETLLTSEDEDETSSSNGQQQPEGGTLIANDSSSSGGMVSWVEKSWRNTIVSLSALVVVVLV